jgi:TrmH family RNA methyltransferase
MKSTDSENQTTQKVYPAPLDSIYIVLSRPRYGGNIGAAARAVKNMGLGGMVISGAEDYLESEARMMAASAGDVLQAAVTTDTLTRALDSFDLVLGASRRVKSSRQRIMNPRDAAGFLAREIGDGRAAIVFGPEDSGLTAEELSMCHGIVSIPADERYPSLNLSQAVMVMAYELRLTQDDEQLRVRTFGEASGEEYHSMLTQVESVLDQTGFFIRNPKKRVMLHLREISTHGIGTSQDARIVRGMFRRISWALKKEEVEKKGKGQKGKRRSGEPE